MCRWDAIPNRPRIDAKIPNCSNKFFCVANSPKGWIETGGIKDDIVVHRLTNFLQPTGNTCFATKIGFLLNMWNILDDHRRMAFESPSTGDGTMQHQCVNTHRRRENRMSFVAS